MSSKLNFILNDLKKVVKKHLLLDDYNIVDVLIATIIANLFKTDPLWLLIIGPSSSAKTELLNALEGLSMTFFLSDLTPSTLISGKKDSSLLPHLNNKIVVMKDFTTILSKRPDHLKMIMAQLREVYDGNISKGFGTGDTIKWRGHVGFVGCCTPVYDRHHSVIGQMGERFILYRSKNKDNIRTGRQALQAFGGETKMRSQLQKAFKRFLSQFKKIDLKIPKPSDLLQDQIVSLATFCGHCRTAVHRDRYTQEFTYLPEAEGSPRLTKQLYHLGLSLMAANGGEQITDEILCILKKVGLDLIPRTRVRIIEYLWESRALEISTFWVTTGEIVSGTGIHGKTTLRTLQDLEIIGIVRSKRDGDSSPYEWQIKNKIIRYIGGCEIFNE